MPGILKDSDTSRKRKRALEGNGSKESKPRKAPKKPTTDTPQARILLLEEQIVQSREHYNNVVELQKYLGGFDEAPEVAILAAVALCRVFSRLIAAEKLVVSKKAEKAEVEVAEWLRSRLQEYTSSLISWIGSPDAAQESTALTLLMRIVKEEASGQPQRATLAWKSTKGTFVTLVRALVNTKDAEGARQEFVEKYMEEHDDVRFHTFVAIAYGLAGGEVLRGDAVSSALDMLAQVEGIPESEEQLEDWYGVEPDSEKHQLLSLTAHRKAAREAWLAIFRSPLTDEQRRHILGIMTARILPWFSNYLELVTDFLTDSFNQGGATSLLALNGIFQLMTEKNLDYPDFYLKLYSLLDDDILHSKHRSRFFRLFNTFMGSTHLPAGLVASFIKRLSRLALLAPPGAIVWIVPWTYNMIKEHPQCAFMLHRVHHPSHAVYASNPRFEEEGLDDPFDMGQRDPMRTGAIDSSLWELDTLRTHFHPNVATLAKILGEQFTKRDYQLEDFLDHSYTSLIDAELGKEMKKTPVVEWDIPKRIVAGEEEGLNALGSSLRHAIDAL